MFATVLNLFAADLKHGLRALTLKVVLVLTGAAVMLVALGFGLSLLNVWLQQLYGTMPALAIVAGGCAVLALILFAIAFRRQRPPQPAAPPRAAPTDIEIARETIASSQRTIDESIAVLQQGSRESMLAAVALAVVTGVILGKKL